MVVVQFNKGCMLLQCVSGHIGFWTVWTSYRKPAAAAVVLHALIVLCLCASLHTGWVWTFMCVGLIQFTSALLLFPHYYRRASICLYFHCMSHFWHNNNQKPPETQMTVWQLELLTGKAAKKDWLKPSCCVKMVTLLGVMFDQSVSFNNHLKHLFPLEKYF